MGGKKKGGKKKKKKGAVVVGQRVTLVRSRTQMIGSSRWTGRL